MAAYNRSAYYRFFELISRCRVSTQLKKDFDERAKRIIVFNDHESEKGFHDALRSSYHQMCSELENESKDFSKKGEYINFLKGKHRQLIELKEEYFQIAPVISHNKFVLDDPKLLKVPKAKQKKEYYQNNINDQYNYLMKSIPFLEDLISTTLSLSSQDIALKPPPDINPNTPSLNKPFAFFEYLIKKKGLITIREDFKPSEDDYYNYGGRLEYDEKEEKIIMWEDDYESGETYENATYFKDVLYQKLVHQFNLALSLIDDKIDGLLSHRDEISNYLNVQLPRLDLIINGVAKFPEAEKYEYILKSLHALVKHIFHKYQPYIDPSVSSLFNEIIPVEAAPLQKLTFTGSSQEFAQIICNLIQDKKLLFKGKPDFSPMVPILDSVFEIKKVKGVGFVKKDSLHTEIKTFMSESAKKSGKK